MKFRKFKKFLKETIIAKDFPLKSNFTLSAAVDLEKAHGIDLEKVLGEDADGVLRTCIKEALSGRKQKITCLLCGRNKFTKKSPHKCVGGYRKHKIKWKIEYEE